MPPRLHGELVECFHSPLQCHQQCFSDFLPSSPQALILGDTSYCQTCYLLEHIIHPDCVKAPAWPYLLLYYYSQQHFSTQFHK
eukprot:Gb_33883 [translate_table: standard]